MAEDQEGELLESMARCINSSRHERELEMSSGLLRLDAEDQVGELLERLARWFNPSRHEHELVISSGLPRYICNGCKEAGADIGYICSQRSSSSCANFTLHQACATLQDEERHPFRSDVKLKFRDETNWWHKCTACRHTLQGYVFENEGRDVRLHPLCLALPKMLHFDGHPSHRLNFVAQGKSQFICNSCDGVIDSGGWKYRCEEVSCRTYLDLGCAKSYFHGLPDPGNNSSWIHRSGHCLISVAKLISSLLACATGISTVMEIVPMD